VTAAPVIHFLGFGEQRDLSLCASESFIHSMPIQVSVLVQRVTCPDCLATINRRLAAQRNAAEVTLLDGAVTGRKA